MDTITGAWDCATAGVVDVLGAGEDFPMGTTLPKGSLIWTALDFFGGLTNWLDCEAEVCWLETGVCDGGGAWGREGVPGWTDDGRSEACDVVRDMLGGWKGGCMLPGGAAY